MRVVVPLARLARARAKCTEHHGEHEIGAMRGFATPALGAGEGREVEVGHGVSNLPCEMIVGQFLVGVAPGFRVCIPGRLGKTS